MVFANLAQAVVGFVVILIGQLAGIANALGFAYVGFMQPRSSIQQSSGQRLDV